MRPLIDGRVNHGWSKPADPVTPSRPSLLDRKHCRFLFRRPIDALSELIALTRNESAAEPEVMNRLPP